MATKKDQKNALLKDTVRSDNYGNNATTETKDKYNLVYFVCMLLGVGNLLAYNFLLAAPDYYINNYGDDRGGSIIFWIVPMYTITDVLFLIFSLIWGERLSFTSRIVFSLILIAIFMFFPIFTGLSLFNLEEFIIQFWILMSVALITGATTATLQPPIVGFCNYLPVEYIQISIAGQALAGIAASVIRILVNLLPIKIEYNAIIYFGICGVMLIMTNILFLFAERTAFVKFHLKDYFWTRKYRKKPMTEDQEDLLQRTDTKTILRKIVDDSIPTPKAKDFEQISQTSTKSQSMKNKTFRDNQENKDDEEKREVTISEPAKTVGSINTTNTDNNNHNDNIYGSDQAGVVIEEVNQQIDVDIDADIDSYIDSDNDKESITYIGVFRKIKSILLALFLVFFVTFLPFPAFVTGIESQYEWIQNSKIIPMPTLLVMIFNIGDYIGRKYLASWKKFQELFSKRTLWIACAWRIVLFPVVICLYKTLIHSDIFAYGTILFIGLTNGWFCCLCFIWAPSCVNSNEQALCGTMMSCALVGGITVGSWVALTMNNFIPYLE